MWLSSLPKQFTAPKKLKIESTSSTSVTDNQTTMISVAHVTIPTTIGYAYTIDLKDIAIQTNNVAPQQNNETFDYICLVGKSINDMAEQKFIAMEMISGCVQNTSISFIAQSNTTTIALEAIYHKIDGSQPASTSIEIGSILVKGYKGSVITRTTTADKPYRFGFNGKEMDNEVSGSGNQYDYGFRIYNPRLGRFLSVDPLAQSYPFYSPYHFAGNSPIANIDLDGLEQIDFRILQKLEFGKIKVDMQKAPDFVYNSNGKKVYTTLKGGRKWNARWYFQQALEQAPEYFSEAASKAIRNGDIPTTDMVFLEKIGQNLSKTELQILKNSSLGSILQHHHLNQGNIAVALSKPLHVGAGNTKFWHIFGKASKTLLKSLSIIGILMSFDAIAKGDFSGSIGLPDPTLAINDFFNSLVTKGLQTGNFNDVKMGLTGTKDNNWSYSYLSNEEMSNYLETGNTPTGSFQNTGIPQYESIDQLYNATGKVLPYMKISYKGKTFGVIELPNN